MTNALGSHLYNSQIFGKGGYRWRLGDQPGVYNDNGDILSVVAEHHRDIIGEDLGDAPTLRDVLDGIERVIKENQGASIVRIGDQTWVRQQPEQPKAIELPKWKSHKIVQADKIVRRRTSGTLVLECGLEIDLADPAREGFANRLQAMMPQQLSGGYYVCYSDGYESWSPAKAFEEGYSRMPYGSHDVNSRLGDICTCGVTREELLDGVASLECPHRPFRA